MPGLFIENGNKLKIPFLCHYLNIQLSVNSGHINRHTQLTVGQVQEAETGGSL